MLAVFFPALPAAAVCYSEGTVHQTLQRDLGAKDKEDGEGVRGDGRGRYCLADLQCEIEGKFVRT